MGPCGPGGPWPQQGGDGRVAWLTDTGLRAATPLRGARVWNPCVVRLRLTDQHGPRSLEWHRKEDQTKEGQPGPGVAREASGEGPGGDVGPQEWPAQAPRKWLSQGPAASPGDTFGRPAGGSWWPLSGWRPGRLLAILQGPGYPVTKEDPAGSVHGAWAETLFCGLCRRDPLTADLSPLGAGGHEAGHSPRDPSRVPVPGPDASPLSPFPGRCGRAPPGPQRA